MLETTGILEIFEDLRETISTAWLGSPLLPELKSDVAEGKSPDLSKVDNQAGALIKGFGTGVGERAI